MTEKESDLVAVTDRFQVRKNDEKLELSERDGMLCITRCNIGVSANLTAFGYPFWN